MKHPILLAVILVSAGIAIGVFIVLSNTDYKEVKIYEDRTVYKEVGDCPECECLCEDEIIYVTECDRVEVESCYTDLDQQTDLKENCKVDLQGCNNALENLIYNCQN